MSYAIYFDYMFILYARVDGRCMGQSMSAALNIERFWFLLPSPMHGLQAYTSQIAVLTMIALAVGEDSISSRERRERIIDGLIALPGRSCWCRVPCARRRLPVVEGCAMDHENLCCSGGLIGLPGRCCWCRAPRSFV